MLSPELDHDSRNKEAMPFVGKQQLRFLSYKLRRRDGKGQVVCSATSGHFVTRPPCMSQDAHGKTRYQLVERFYALPKCWNKKWTQDLMQRNVDDLALAIKDAAELLVEKRKQELEAMILPALTLTIESSEGPVHSVLHPGT